MESPFVTPDDLLSYLVSPQSVPKSSFYERDNSKFKQNRLTIHAMVHIFDPTSPHVYYSTHAITCLSDYLKAKEKINGLSGPDGFDIDALKIESEKVCRSVIDEFFTSRDASPAPKTLGEENADFQNGLGVDPLPDYFCSVGVFYQTPVVPSKSPPPKLVMSLAEEDSHHGRVVRQEELETLGLGTLRLLIDITWFERTPFHLSQADLKPSSRGAGGKIDSEPGQVLAVFDGQGDLESADKLAAWMSAQEHPSLPPANTLAEEDHGEKREGSLTAAGKKRNVDSSGDEEGVAAVLASSSSTIKGGQLDYLFFDGVPVTVKPPGYGRERRLRHTIASRLTELPFVSHPLIVQILMECDARGKPSCLPD